MKSLRKRALLGLLLAPLAIYACSDDEGGSAPRPDASDASVEAGAEAPGPNASSALDRPDPTSLLPRPPTNGRLPADLLPPGR